MHPAQPRPNVADDVLQDLADAYRILAHQGIVDAFGHVSLRHPERADRFLLARNMAPALVTPDDILEFDLDGNACLGDTRKVYLERFIHAEIFRARADVMAVVHSHSPTVVPFSVVKSAKLRPVCHMCGFLRDGPPIFEIRDSFGDATNLLISNQAQGKALAQTLGQHHAVLMRGHGSTVVGHSLKMAVYRAVYTEVNAQLLSTALPLGEVTYLTDDECLATMEVHESQINRPWDLWKKAAAESR